ncbi:MAG: hypothetical protein PHX64_05800 [Candidatus Omnitrophica bacterium]|nr:hypothetical protein [Candidatus Omnitrophota bacterium]MDD5311247.1 hypothetical protein [Candidatus Omnitrophota bacterium]MDD5545720.1 hypothetical protein [Candidatus Omnitrophota bacterium]
MSIILEALKKASAAGNTPPLAAGTTAKNLEEKIEEVAGVSDSGGFNLSRTMLMAAAAIVIVGLVAFLTLPQGGTQNGTTEANNVIASLPSSPEANGRPAAEGYSTVPPPAPSKQEVTPIGSFITKLSNPRLTLSGIVYGAGKPAAIIENKILEEGASIKGARIVKIHNSSVEMLDEVTGQGFVLKLD